MNNIHSHQLPLVKIFTFLIIVLLITSCEDWNLEVADFLEVETSSSIEMGENGVDVILYGEIKGLSANNSVDQHGHVWSSTVDMPTLQDKDGQTTFLKRGNGTFSSTLERLAPGQFYYFRAYALDENEPVYGEVQSFTNASITFEAIIESITNQTQVSDLFEADITTEISIEEQGVFIADYGIVWGVESQPTIEEQSFISKSSTSSDGSVISFTERVTDLQVGENYIRPYLIIGGIIFYGEELLFKIEDVWIRRSDFPGQPQTGPAVFSIDGKGYVGAGSGQKDFWEYHPETDTWTQKADFPGQAEFFSSGFSIGGLGYVTSGSGSDPPNFVTNEFWEYNPQIDTWNQRAPFEAIGRRNASTFVINDKAYIGLGGYFDTGFNYLESFWEYDPQTDTWTQKADFEGEARSFAVGFSIGAKGYFGTGRGVSGDRLSDFWEYDPLNDSWIQKADFGGGIRSGPIGFSIGDKGYIGTGINLNSNPKDWWEYDPTNDTWTQKNDFGGIEGVNGVGFSIDGRGYVYFGSFREDFWEYIPETD